MSLAGHTAVYCAHEYTLANARFALTAGPLLAHSVPVYPCCTHAPFRVLPPWPGRPFPGCVFTLYQCTRTHSPHPPPWPGLSFF